MTALQSLLAFSLAATLLTITPGLDTAMVLRAATLDGSARARWASVGVSLGCLVWGVAASIGLGALLSASELAFSILKWTGAVYLCWMGATLLLKPRSALAGGETAANGAGGFEALRRGFLTNILNPKVGVFYVTFLPQFTPADVSVASFSLLLTLIHVGLGLIWFEILIAAARPMRRILSRPRVVAALDRGTGGVFVLFGVKLALSRA